MPQTKKERPDEPLEKDAAPPQEAREKNRERIARLVRKSFFSGFLGPEALDELTVDAVLKHYKTGEYLPTRGDQAQGLHMVTKGGFNVSMCNSAGLERIIVQLEVGHLVGPGVILRSQGYPFWIRAYEPTETIFIPRPSFLAHLSNNPLAMALLEALTRRLNFYYELLDSSGERVVPKLATFLLGLRESDGGRLVMPRRMNKTQMAMRLGITSESLSRALSRLKAAGVIKERGRDLIILDRPAMTSLAINGKAMQ